MDDSISTKTMIVTLQENGIIRNSKGYLIGRLTNEITFNSEHIFEIRDIILEKLNSYDKE